VISALVSRALAEDEAADPLEPVLDRYLEGIPAAIDALVAMTRAAESRRTAAFVAGQALLYLVDEDDLVSEAAAGRRGLLDDAYFLHACLRRLRSACPEAPAPPGYAPPGEESTAAVAAALPAGVPEALERAADRLVEVAGALSVLGA
jgi:hypothetical protein